MKTFVINADVYITEHYKLYDVKITEQDVEAYCEIHNYKKEEVIADIQEHARGIINYLDSEFGMYDFAYFKNSELEVYNQTIEELIEVGESNGNKVQS
jgi:hypothetical protein